ncbi:MAG TPA: hypothetical protein VNS46_15805 [Nocardioides sp.]|nr:hypothetical protein [Nocardioides sp.]
MKTLRKLLVVAAVGAAVTAIAKRLQGGAGEPVWQSAPPAE